MAADWQARQVEFVFRQVYPLAETLLESLCCGLRANFSCVNGRGCLQCASSVDHDGAFFTIRPAVVNTLHKNSLLRFLHQSMPSPSPFNQPIQLPDQCPLTLTAFFTSRQMIEKRG
jgi:hypothetical protein